MKISPRAIVGIAFLPLVGLVVGSMIGIWTVAAANDTSFVNPSVFLEGVLLFPVPVAGGVGGLLAGLMSGVIALASGRIRARSTRVVTFVAVATALIWLGSTMAITLVSITAGLGAVWPNLLTASAAGLLLAVVLLALIGWTTQWKGSVLARS